jgi:hypothetical protein
MLLTSIPAFALFPFLRILCYRYLKDSLVSRYVLPLHVLLRTVVSIFMHDYSIKPYIIILL